MSNVMALFLAIVGAAAVAFGIGLLFIPAGVIVGGAEALGAAYLIVDVKARHRS